MESSFLPDPDSLRCFVEAARLLNFRAAARSVGRTPAALGQRIRKLEDQLGKPLFDRNTHRVVLTEAGLALLPAAREALRAARECLGVVGEAPPTDLVIGTRHELGLSWLLPALPRLRTRHPAVTFHLYFGSGPDLELRVRAGSIDCAISSRRLTDPKIDFVRLHREDYVFVGAPTLLADRPLRDAEHARAHTVIDAHVELPLFQYWRSAPGAFDALEFGRQVVMGTIAAIRDQVRCGQGVAVLPRYLVAEDLAERRLVEVLPQVEAPFDWFRLLFRADDPRRTLFASVAETLKAEPLR